MPPDLEDARQSPATTSSTDDDAMLARVRAGDTSAFEQLMRRYNCRLFRLARSVLRDDHEAEDVVQETYVRAYRALARFEGRARFSTWISRIAFHESLARMRKRDRTLLVDFSAAERDELHPPSGELPPEQLASGKELGTLLAEAIDALPIDLRTVFVLRMVEGLDTQETAASLDLTPANVKVRLHRARAMLRERIDRQVGAAVRELYQFAGERCNRIVRHVLAATLPESRRHP